MVAKLLWLIPLAALAVMLCFFVLASAFPLSWFEKVVEYNGGYKAGFSTSTLVASVPFYYLLVFGGLSLFLSTSPWLRGVISLVVTLLIFGWTAVNGYAAGVAAGGGAKVEGGDELMLPVVQLERFLFFITGPIRTNHYLNHLEDANQNTRREAVSEISSLAREGRRTHDLSLIRIMAKAFKNSPDQDERQELAGSLFASETNDREALQNIVSVLKSPDIVCRIQAAILLGNLKPALPEAAEALLAVVEVDPEPDVRYHAAKALAFGMRNKDARLQNSLLAAIERGEPWGAEVLNDIDQCDPRVPEAFIRFLNDKRPAVRSAWLNEVEKEHKEIRDSFATHGICGSRLVKDPVHGPALRSIMLELTRDSDLSVRASAIKAVTRAFPKDAEALDVFIAALQNPNKEICRSALDGIEKNGSRDPRVTRALLQAMKNADRDTHWSLALQLIKCDMSDPQIQLGMVEVIRDNTKEIDDMVAVELANAKPHTPKVIEALAGLLTHHNTWVRAAGAKILGDINVQDARIQVLLVKQLTSGEGEGMFDLRYEVRAALRHIHPLSSQAVAELSRLAQGSDEELARTAQDLLKSKEP
jgi:HEAT repeat protein